MADDSREYAWRELMGLYRPSRVAINFSGRTIDFYNSIKSNGFFNLIHQKYVHCPFNDVTEVSAFTMNGIRCLSVQTKHGNCVYMEDVVPRFDEFVADFHEIAPTD